MLLGKVGLTLCTFALSFPLFAQDSRVPEPGDTSAQPGPLATDLSGDLQSAAIRRAMRRVADWQLTRVAGKPSQDWTYATLYDGLISAGNDLGEPRYTQAVRGVGEHFHWTLGARELHADDQAIGKSHLALYGETPDDALLAPMKAQFGRILSMPQDATRPTWWWCDALYMAPSVWAGLAKATGDAHYREYMHREWEVADHLLWDEQEHLFFRDLTFFDRRERNGKKVFWSRGNGWVLAGLAHTLEQLPADDRKRPFYEQRFRQLAERIAGLQGADGMWRPGLLDQGSYPLPETSGSAFFVYGIAWGMDHGLLNRKRYREIVVKGWRALVAHVYQDGRLGSVQPIGAAPGVFEPGSSYVYGVGAFLMAGAELDHMSQNPVRTR